MYRVEIEVKLVDDRTGEQAKSIFGGDPVGKKSSYYPLIVDVRRGEEIIHKLHDTVKNMMSLGNDFYRLGGEQKDL